MVTSLFRLIKNIHVSERLAVAANEINTLSPLFVLSYGKAHVTKRGFSVPSRVAADFRGNTARKMAAPQHVFTRETVSQQPLACACISGGFWTHGGEAPACISNKSRSLPGLRANWRVTFLISERPPLAQAPRSASVRQKNGDRKADPAFHPHVTDSRRGGVGGVRVWWRRHVQVSAPT